MMTMTPESSRYELHEFADGAQLALALAQAVAQNLRSAIAQRNHALIAVSGGKTPIHFFHALSQQSVDWPKVCVTLVDERWAPASDARSNEGFVRANLLVGAAAAARFVPLYELGAPTPEQALVTVSARIAQLQRPFDALVLGMGDDGHTASFFPGGDHLGEATDPHSTLLVTPMHAADAGEPRITLTLPVVLDSRALYLHIEGRRKREVFDGALRDDSKLPIASVLRNARHSLQVFWCP